MARMRIVWGVAALLWMGVIFRLSALPGSAIPGHFSSLGHFVLYAVLGGLYFMALPKKTPGSLRWAILAIVLASAYGVTDEFHQSFVPGRVPDVMDWLVDTAGALATVSLLTAWRAATARARRQAC